MILDARQFSLILLHSLSTVIVHIIKVYFRKVKIIKDDILENCRRSFFSMNFPTHNFKCFSKLASLYYGYTSVSISYLSHISSRKNLCGFFRV